MAAVEINNSSYLFRPSGSGKSTLSANLSIKHNANFICEDVAYIQRFKINTALWMHQNL